ncbi:MAG TPA: metal-dependent hydrolase [Thermoanaerobaculia bacterium]|nr:metal-dependent hydrolase [Thermoanaerobaculia bacterium]
MDPLTHTLVGANLAATRLGEKTRLAAAALVIGANLPDVDSILYFTNHDDLALGFRRGWTHGVLALVLLPLIQTALLLLYARLRPDPERPVSARWLLILSAFAILTHPFLDWLNNYGMRWLMPFDGTWFYGDSVFIMDPWLWLVLGAGWLAGKRASLPLFGLWLFFSAAILWIVSGRAPVYVPIVIGVALVLLAALFWRAPRSLATIALIIACAYIGARLTIHAITANVVRNELQDVRRLMVSPHPMDPRRWEVVAQMGDVYRFGGYDWRTRTLKLADDRLPVAKPSAEWDAARRHPSIRGFVTWMRFPWYEVERIPEGTRVLVHDARYATRRRAGSGFGGVEVVLPNR